VQQFHHRATAELFVKQVSSQGIQLSCLWNSFITWRTAELFVSTEFHMAVCTVCDKSERGPSMRLQLHDAECQVLCTWMNYITVIFQVHRHRCLFLYIRFWYLRCCSCPWNRGRQHLATPLKTCHNTEAGFLTGWLLCLSPNSEVTDIISRHHCICPEFKLTSVSYVDNPRESPWNHTQ